MRRLIVNADDLGYDPAIDRGILEAHAGGLVTSATAMVDTPFAQAALAAAPATLGVGLHAVLAAGLDEAGARAELERQLERFQALRGAAPTHLDSHRHAHAEPAILRAFAAVAAARRLPVRAITPAMRDALRGWGIATADRFLGDAARRPAWTEAGLAEALSRLEEGLSELMAHPGHAPTHVRTSFGAEREIELLALTSPRCRAALAAAGGVLCSYAALAG